MYRLAQLISIIFSPLTFVPLLFFLLIISNTHTNHEFIVAAILLYGLTFLPVIGSLIYLKYTKRVSDWGIYKRDERYLLNNIAFVSVAIAAIIASFTTAAKIAHFMNFMLILAGVFAIITRFWKISAHTSAVSLFVTAVVTWFGYRYIWLGIIVLLVAWARVYQKKHTLLQAGAGILITVFLFLLVNILGLL